MKSRFISTKFNHYIYFLTEVRSPKGIPNDKFSRIVREKSKSKTNPKAWRLKFGISQIHYRCRSKKRPCIRIITIRCVHFNSIEFNWVFSQRQRVNLKHKTYKRRHAETYRGIIFTKFNIWKITISKVLLLELYSHK